MRAGSRVGVALVLAAALAVRVAAALNKSLVLDEFHTWFHATRPSVQAFFETLKLDNHPPLGFAVVALSRAVLGSSELALRAPALLFGLVELALVFVLARRWWGERVALAATALLAASSLHVDFSSQARMYALHSLAATVTLLALARLITGAPTRTAQVVLALSLTVAFHTHYFGGQYVLAYALALGVLALFDERARARVRRLAAPVLVASVSCAPWALTGMREQLAHALPPGGDDHSLAGLAEAFIHLFFLNVRLGGAGGREVFIAGGLAVLLLAARGAALLFDDIERRPLAVLCATAAFGTPVLAWCISNLAPRAGFTWHYVLPSAVPMALLAAAGARGALRWVFAVALALAATLTALNLATRGTEDFRSAVAHVLEVRQPGDAVVSVEWQPALFPAGQPYDYYAPRLSSAPAPRLEVRHYTLPDPRVLAGVSRVILLAKSLPRSQHLYGLLEADFTCVEREAFGFALEVSVWVRRR